MSALVALRLARGGQKADVQILRSLAFDNQTGNFTAGLVLTGIGVLGTGVLTGTTIADGDTVTIGDITYTFQDTLVDAPYNVHVGATDSDSLDNLIAAINGSGGTEGTDYGTGTLPHPLVSAAAGVGDTMDVTALEADGAAIATVASLTSGGFGAAALAGGIAASGATARLVEQTDNGTSGTLILRDVRGEFADNERIVDTSTGVALVSGALGIPLLTPSDAMILQLDGEDIDRAEALDLVHHLASKIQEMPWHADSGLFALYAKHGAIESEVLRLGALAYDGQSGNFAVGEVVTGGDSDATGIVFRDTDGGTSGTLILQDVQGIFENDEALTGDATGAATVNGVQAIPLLTPSGEFILQVDGVDFTKAEALECLRQIGLALQDMDFPLAAAA